MGLRDSLPTSPQGLAGRRHDAPHVDCERRFPGSTAPAYCDGQRLSIVAARRCHLTVEELLKENKRLNVNLEGLKV